MSRQDFPADVQVENLTANRTEFIGGMLFRPNETRTVKVRALWVWMALVSNVHLRVTYLGAAAFAGGDAGPDHASAPIGGSDHDREKQKASARRKAKAGGGS
jgi:hypothetical protein